MNIYDFKVKRADGSYRSMEEMKGKVLLIVNTATACGFTPQYKDLQSLYETYQDQGFEVLDFPCNQFANQATGSDDEIATFCTGRFGTTFEHFSKIDVNGANEEPLYTYLKAQKKGILGSQIKWNFTKFLVDRDGNVVKRVSPNVVPSKLEKDIKNLL